MLARVVAAAPSAAVPASAVVDEDVVGVNDVVDPAVGAVVAAEVVVERNNSSRPTT